MVKLVDTRDLKSLGWKRLCRFDSGSGHQSAALAQLVEHQFSKLNVIGSRPIRRSKYLIKGN